MTFNGRSYSGPYFAIPALIALYLFILRLRNRQRCATPISAVREALGASNRACTATSLPCFSCWQRR